MIIKEIWGNFSLFTLENEFLRVRVSDLGATLVSLQYKGQERVIGYETPEDYLASNDFLGATVGRYANRIAGAAFTLDGKRYTLTANEGRNQLHGGTAGLLHNKRRWEAAIEGESLRFSLLSPAGDNGFPGEIKETVRYSLSGATTLRLDFEGECDAATHFAPTNHSYFDLSGGRNPMGQLLRLDADRFCEGDENTLPTGRLLEVEGTPFDFREEKPVGRDLHTVTPQLTMCGGYDHNFVLKNGGRLRTFARLRSPETGIAMRSATDLPGVQLYSGNFVTGTGKGGRAYGANDAVCLESQFFPNALAVEGWDKPILRAGEKFDHTTVYAFG